MSAALLAGLIFPLASVMAATPPPQPASGPGGSSYAYDVVDSVIRGTGPLQYWLFTPDTTGPGGPPATAPVIAFFHGYNALNPDTYRGWIDHLVKRGAIVIFPRFQQDASSHPDQYTANAIMAIRAALDFIVSRGTAPQAEPGRFACIGHSIGGVTSASVAATGPAQGLPVARALMSVQSGKTTAWGPPLGLFTLPDLSLLPSETLLLSVMGADDMLTQDIDSKRIFWESDNIPFANKNFIIVHSDTEEGTTLSADHASPAAGMNGPDSLDYYAYWKLGDALVSAAWYGIDREYALGNAPQQRFMGIWSTGRPVKELTAFDLRQPLEISVAASAVTLRWPYIMDGWTLEGSADLGPGAWPVWPDAPVRAGDFLEIATPIVPSGRFFRLRKPG